MTTASTASSTGSASRPRVSPRSAESLICPPRWATPRSPDRPTLGPRVAEVAAQLGTPLMPWQQYVVDVALELDPETGQLAYREVVLTVPRDRKSTRLNSSHVKISYAVFC